MATNTHKILTLSRAGGGKLDIHPDEWPALVQAVTDALQLDADPAVALEDLPPAKHYAASPLGNDRKLVAEFSIFGAARPLAGHHRANFGSD